MKGDGNESKPSLRILQKQKAKELQLVVLIRYKKLLRHHRDTVQVRYNWDASTMHNTIGSENNERPLYVQIFGVINTKTSGSYAIA